ncbi:transcriptional regulator, BadM/Rrf2 family [Faunimonas pinastri]|uniref:Transcriptional regulator, BadM/Rrf2 family n=1 Tax=Faunimonas pinastri TaxID=1855383 RepID=A0A1H8ZZQ0_9HYPH|nr:Rrf2 family transcriptional regulator [Faunimonas pinastri]SEP69966.1 transcriptional regulator, BadM/Rrf2 family [Faunimonas pinastri]
MRLTKQTSYALRILIYCALRPDEQVRAGDIARAYQITEFNVLKIVPLLVQGGFVRTTRGRNGGLRLARDPREIRIGEIVRLTEESHVQADCFGQAAERCPIQPASPVNRILQQALKAFIDILDQHTLQELVDARPRFGSRQPSPEVLPDVNVLGDLSALLPN